MRKLIFLGLLVSGISFANVLEEQLYDKYIATIHSPAAVTAKINVSQLKDKKLFIDALWDSTIMANRMQSSSIVANIDPTDFELADAVRIEIIKAWPTKPQLSQFTEDRYRQMLKSGHVSRRDAIMLSTLSDFISIPEDIFKFARGIVPGMFKDLFVTKRGFQKKTAKEIQNLYFNSPKTYSYNGGRYNGGVRLFIFCRYNRVYKCTMLMKDKDNKPIFLKDGKTLWNHPALGMSRKRLPSSVRNGNTPEGVLTINSVMPTANKKRVYGKFRRLILNFVPKSNGEANIKSFLPKSAHSKNWWHSGVVARDAGRNLLRIHGSGIKRSSKGEPNHPLRPTLGCVMQRELKFGKVTYKDQRKLLDKMMTAQGLEPKYANESKIKGVLYFIELDKQKRSVTYKDIAKLLGLP